MSITTIGVRFVFNGPLLSTLIVAFKQIKSYSYISNVQYNSSKPLVKKPLRKRQYDILTIHQPVVTSIFFFRIYT